MNYKTFLLLIITVFSLCLRPLFAQSDAGRSREDVIPEEDALPAQTSQSQDSLTDKSITMNKLGMSLDLKSIEISDFFKMLSLKMGKNIILSKGVSGRVNVFLNNISFEDALAIILVNYGLAREEHDDIINIMTAAEYETLFGKKYNEKRKIKSVALRYAKPETMVSVLSQLKSDVGKIIIDQPSGTLILLDVPEKLALLEETVKMLDKPLKKEIIELNYAKSADIKSALASAVTPGTGELITDEKTSRLALSDLPGRMSEIKDIITAFDRKPYQVFIDAEIVQVVFNRQFQRGVEWEKLFSQNSLKNLDFTGKFPVSPTLSAYQKVSVGNLSRDNYTAAMNFLNTYGETKILSRPRIAALNNQEAKILVGAREAYISQTLSQAQTTTVTSENVQFIDVGVKLFVVPTINKDGFVTLKIKPEVSSVRETVVTSAGSRIPIVETSEAETVITVKEGTMVMIAGLMKEEKRDDNLSVPGLSKIPFLGALFGTRSTQNKQTELIVFITPRLMSGEEDIDITKYLPADMATGEIKDEIFSKKIAAIGKDTIGKAGLDSSGVKVSSATEQVREVMPLGQGKTGSDIQDKMKGLKKIP